MELGHCAICPTLEFCTTRKGCCALPLICIPVCIGLACCSLNMNAQMVSIVSSNVRVGICFYSWDVHLSVTASGHALQRESPTVTKANVTARLISLAGHDGSLLLRLMSWLRLVPNCDTPAWQQPSSFPIALLIH